jgi:uncharacterized SAM-binding protein YcdF (DUF218 family)
MDWDLFYLKKIVSRVFYPEYIALFILIMGTIWVLRTKHLAGLFLLSGGALSLVAATLPLTGFLLIRPLEMRAGPAPDIQTMIGAGIGNIVVLQDLAEVTELWKKIPGSRLIISSGDCGTKLIDAARESGLPDHLIVWETRARDTQEQAERLKYVLGNERFALVTWAGHMPRAVMTFERLNLNPIPVPMAFAEPPESWLAALRPNGNGLMLTKRAIHEYVGILWIFLKTKVRGMRN